jgi:hypothetical protein
MPFYPHCRGFLAAPPLHRDSMTLFLVFLRRKCALQGPLTEEKLSHVAEDRALQKHLGTLQAAAGSLLTAAAREHSVCLALSASHAELRAADAEVRGLRREAEASQRTVQASQREISCLQAVCDPLFRSVRLVEVCQNIID